MTKIIADLKSPEHIDQYQTDGLILSSAAFSTYNDRCYSLEEIRALVDLCKAHHKMVILNIDKIMEEEELEPLFCYLDQCLTLDIDYFIYGDFSVLSFFEERKLVNRLIYDPKTLITSRAEAMAHQELVAISNELTIEEIEETAKSGNAIMEVYGYHQIFYSRRQVLSSFAKYQNLGRILDRRKLFIREEKRDDDYPLYQSQHGTFIYTPYRYCFIRGLFPLLEHLQMIRIHSLFIDETEILKVIAIYRDYLCGNLGDEAAYRMLQDISPEISEGFLHNKSILVKEDE